MIEEYSKLPADVFPRKGWEGLPALAWATVDEQWLFASGQYLARQRRGDMHADTFSNLSGFAPRNIMDAVVLSPNQKRVYVHEIEGSAHIVKDLQKAEEIGFGTGWDASWHTDSRRILFENLGIVRAYDAVSHQWLGTLWPELSDGGWLVIGPTGHCRGSKGIAEHVVYVAQLDDGSNITLTPQEFAKRFGWKNDPEKATLMAWPE